jgi:phage gp36-like protein
MSYASLTDLIARAGDAEIRQIADRDRDGIADQAVVDAALVDADNLINGYVGVKYDVPLVSVPDLVRTWAVSVARYILHRNGAPENVAQDYKDAIAALKDVAGGRIALPVATGGTPVATTGNQVMSGGPDDVFTAERLRGW